MRTATVEIGGVKYPAAFSLGVMRDVEDRTGRASWQGLDALSESGKITDTVWLLSELLAAGKEVTGSDLTPPTEEELYNMLGIDDIHLLTASVLEATRTIKPVLEVEAKKRNAKWRLALRTLLGLR